VHSLGVVEALNVIVHQLPCVSPHGNQVPVFTCLLMKGDTVPVLGYSLIHLWPQCRHSSGNATCPSERKGAGDNLITYQAPDAGCCPAELSGYCRAASPVKSRTSYKGISGTSALSEASGKASLHDLNIMYRFMDIIDMKNHSYILFTVIYTYGDPI